MQQDGSVAISNLLKLPKFKDVTVEQIRQVVDTNEKKRMTLPSERGKTTMDALDIRANQGHSIKVNLLDILQDDVGAR